MRSNNNRARPSNARTAFSVLFVLPVVLFLFPVRVLPTVVGQDKCKEDPVVGTWIALTTHGERKQHLTLRIDENKAGKLRGLLLNLSYSPNLNPSQPPSHCENPDHIIRFRLPGDGTLSGNDFFFRTIELTGTERICMDPTQPDWNYEMDRFKGRLDKKAGTITVIWDDDVYVIHKPIIFRRVSCT